MPKAREINWYVQHLLFILCIHSLEACGFTEIIAKPPRCWAPKPTVRARPAKTQPKKQKTKNLENGGRLRTFAINFTEICINIGFYLAAAQRRKTERELSLVDALLNVTTSVKVVMFKPHTFILQESTGGHKWAFKIHGVTVYSSVHTTSKSYFRPKHGSVTSEA